MEIAADGTGHDLVTARRDSTRKHLRAPLENSLKPPIENTLKGTLRPYRGLNPPTRDMF